MIPEKVTLIFLCNMTFYIFRTVEWNHWPLEATSILRSWQRQLRMKRSNRQLPDALNQDLANKSGMISIIIFWKLSHFLFPLFLNLISMIGNPLYLSRFCINLKGRSVEIYICITQNWLQPAYESFRDCVYFWISDLEYVGQMFLNFLLIKYLQN